MHLSRSRNNFRKFFLGHRPLPHLSACVAGQRERAGSHTALYGNYLCSLTPRPKQGSRCRSKCPPFARDERATPACRVPRTATCAALRVFHTASRAICTPFGQCHSPPCGSASRASAQSRGRRAFWMQPSLPFCIGPTDAFMHSDLSSSPTSDDCGIMAALISRELLCSRSPPYGAT